MAILLDHRLKRFIADHIHSVELLEVLCLVAKDAEKPWTVDEVFRTIQSNRDSIELRLKALVSAGLAEAGGSGCYRYKPKDPETADCVRKLRAAYKESRVKVIEAIYAPVDPAQTFADSFRLKKDR